MGEVEQSVTERGFGLGQLAEITGFAKCCEQPLALFQIGRFPGAGGLAMREVRRARRGLFKKISLTPTQVGMERPFPSFQVTVSTNPC